MVYNVNKEWNLKNGYLHKFTCCELISQITSHLRQQMARSLYLSKRYSIRDATPAIAPITVHMLINAENIMCLSSLEMYFPREGRTVPPVCPPLRDKCSEVTIFFNHRPSTKRQNLTVNGEIPQQHYTPFCHICQCLYYRKVRFYYRIFGNSASKKVEKLPPIGRN